MSCWAWMTEKTQICTRAVLQEKKNVYIHTGLWKQAFVQFYTPNMGLKVKIKHKVVVWEVHTETWIELEWRPKKFLLSVQEALLPDKMWKIHNNVSRLHIVFLACLIEIEDCVVTALLPLWLFEIKGKKRPVFFLPPNLWSKHGGLFLFNLYNRKHLLGLRI